MQPETCDRLNQRIADIQRNANGEDAVVVDRPMCVGMPAVTVCVSVPVAMSLLLRVRTGGRAVCVTVVMRVRVARMACVVRCVVRMMAVHARNATARFVPTSSRQRDGRPRNDARSIGADQHFHVFADAAGKRGQVITALKQ